MEFRKPRVQDGGWMWEVTRANGELDLNSPYAYLMMCEYFAETCVVVEEDGERLGFVLGFRLPDDPETFFVWQVTTDPAHRGKGLARRMVTAILERVVDRDVRFLEATVTPSNESSQRLFRGFGRRLGVECAETTAFSAELFPGGGHESELRFRIGPFTAAAVAAHEHREGAGSPE